MTLFLLMMLGIIIATMILVVFYLVLELRETGRDANYPVCEKEMIHCLMEFEDYIKYDDFGWWDR